MSLFWPFKDISLEEGQPRQGAGRKLGPSATFPFKCQHDNLTISEAWTEPLDESIEPVILCGKLFPHQKLGNRRRPAVASDQATAVAYMYEARGNRVRVNLTTDDSVSGGGFNASWFALKRSAPPAAASALLDGTLANAESCSNQTLIDNSGWIANPGYNIDPEWYPPGSSLTAAMSPVDCWMTLLAPGKQTTSNL